MNYFQRIVAWLSQGANSMILNGSHDMTVSARCYVEYRLKHNKRWHWPYRIINAIFFWQNDHCMESFLEDVAFAKEVIQWMQSAK